MRARTLADLLDAEAQGAAAQPVIERGETERERAADQQQDGLNRPRRQRQREVEGGAPEAKEEAAVDHQERDILARLALVMPVVFVGDEIGPDHDANVGGVELMIDHGAVADEAAEAEIALDQRRQSPRARAPDRKRSRARRRIST